MKRRLRVNKYLLERKIRYLFRKDFHFPLENLKIRSTFVPDGRTIEEWRKDPPFDPMKVHREERLKYLNLDKS